MKTAAKSANEDPEVCRLDVWLWRARFFKTRALAAEFAEAGKVRRASLTPDAPPTRLTKAGTPVRPGDLLIFALGGTAVQARILALGERRGPAIEARTLYELNDGNN